MSPSSSIILSNMLDSRANSLPDSTSPNNTNRLQKTTNRKRAAFACKPCNVRRLKCDAVEAGWPCSRCRSLGRQSDCELHQSRRGKYPRANSKSTQFNASPTAISPITIREQPPELGSLAIISDVAAASQPLMPMTTSTIDPMLEESTPGWIDTVDSQGSGSNGMMENEELRDTSPAFSTRPPSPKAPADMVYANLFDDDRRSRTPGQTIFYLGHATHNMAYMLSHKGPPFLHTPILDAGAVRKPLPPDETAFLRARGYHDLPPLHVQTELIRTYFAVVQPTFPVIDRVEFARSYESQSPPSLLLLQAMFMVAATHVPLQFLLDAGFKTRHDGKRTFYRRAKGLFDADYEPNRTVNIQAAFLLQFYWESPLAQKDACYWLNCAISLAQGCGMHRCTEKSGLSPSDRKLWRRIWAYLEMRDGHTQMAFGKPLQIQKIDCDVEPMSETDFIEEGIEQIDVSLFGQCTRQHMLYSLNMLRLHEIVVLICSAHSPLRVRDTSIEAKALLLQWNQKLELEMQYESNPHPDFFVRILHIFSSYLTILVHRSATHLAEAQQPQNPHSPQALRAANFINLLFDELLTENEIHMCPTNLVPGLFAAMSIHLSMAGFLEPVPKIDRIAKHRLRVSMMAMKELSGYWPVCTWIFQLFSKIIKERSVPQQPPTTLPIAQEQLVPVPHVDENFGNWAEIEEFTSTLGMTDGLDFDFSHIFEVGGDALGTFGVPGMPTSNDSFPTFLGAT